MSKVIMICGVSGSGKTYLAKLLELKGVPRLSIDNELWPDFYVLSDLLSKEHKNYLYSEATKRIVARMKNYISENKVCTIDMPFCHRETRDYFRAQIEEAGGKPLLLWLKADLPVLKQRLCDRKGKNGPDNLPVSAEEVERYQKGFEPITETECVVINTENPIDIDSVFKNL